MPWADNRTTSCGICGCKRNSGSARGTKRSGRKVITDPRDLTIEGSNLDSTKARLLLIASMLKLGAFPRAKDALNPSSHERGAES